MTRRSREKYYPGCLNSFKHSGRTLVMDWGAICDKQVTDLVEFRKTLKQTKKGGNKNSVSSADYIHAGWSVYSLFSGCSFMVSTTSDRCQGITTFEH